MSAKTRPGNYAPTEGADTDPMAIDAWDDETCAHFGKAPDHQTHAKDEDVIAQPAVDLPLPSIWRILSLERTITPDQRIANRAVLFHSRCTLSVHWLSQHCDVRLHRHGLARIRPCLGPHSTDGALHIDRLLPATFPDAVTNLFETIPTGWCADRSRIQRAAGLWSKLAQQDAALFNAMLWASSRFHRYVMGPSSLKGHHAELGGNFRHSIEVAEAAMALVTHTPQASVSLLILGALLHDAGKADEYVYDRQRRSFRLSDRGELVGHRTTLAEWLAVARERVRGYPEARYVALMHMLGAARGAPPWLGLREPRSVEAEILALADRLSGTQDLHRRCAPEDGHAFGHGHPHLPGRPYVVPQPIPMAA